MLEESNGQGYNNDTGKYENALALINSEEPAELDEVAFQNGIDKLSEFSQVLSGALSTLGRTVHNIESQVKHHVAAISEINSVMADHTHLLSVPRIAVAPASRPSSSPSRPMSSRRRPRSGEVQILPMTDREIAEDLLEKEKPAVHATLEEAMQMLKGHHLKPVSVASIHEDLTAPVIKPKSARSRPTSSAGTATVGSGSGTVGTATVGTGTTTSGIAMVTAEEGIIRDRAEEIQQAPIYNAAAEVLFEKLANRVNELEDCIKIQEAVNDGLVGALNEHGEKLKRTESTGNGKIHELDLKLDSVKADLRSISGTMAAVEKGQKKLMADMEKMQAAILALQTRPASTRSNTGLASPVKRPASALPPPEQQPPTDPRPPSGVAGVAEDEKIGTLLYGDETDGGLMDTNYEELFKRIEDLEAKSTHLDAKCTENASLSTDANLGVRRLLLEVQDVSSQLDGVLSREEQKGGGGSRTDGLTPSAKDFTNNEVLGAALKKMKASWTRVYDDLHFGIDQLETSGIANLFSDAFYVGVCEFRTKLRTVNEAIEMEMNTDKAEIAAAAAAALAQNASAAAGRSVSVPTTGVIPKKSTVNYLAVLVKIHPQLYQLEIDAEHLMHLDHQSKENIKKGIVEEEMGVTTGSTGRNGHMPTPTARKKSSAPFSAPKNAVGGLSSLASSSISKEDQVLEEAVIHRDAEGEIIHRYLSTMCFNDIVCVDHTNSLLPRMQEGLILTTPLVDELLDKFHLKHRIDMLESRIVTKATKNMFAKMEQEMKMKLNAKVEHTDFTATMTKKASVSELQQFRELTYKQLDDIRNSLANDQIHGGPPNIGFVAMDKNRLPDNEESEKEKAERTVIFNRFELLHKQFNDLTMYCEKFVPRDEVEKAMHAIVVQVKLLKTNGVELPVMKEALKKKADAEDVKK